MAWRFETDCVNSDGDSITAMNDQAEEISYRTMLKAVGQPFIEKQAELGYDTGNQRGGLRLSKDWAVSYYRSVYRGRPCYFFRWSHIEQIFTQGGGSDFDGLRDTRVKLGATQAGGVEIYVTDDCHESRLTLDGQTLVVPAGMSLFDAAGEIIEAANSADEDALRADNAEDRAGFRELRDALSAVATKLGKLDRSSR